jgi:hypothetical protein
MARTSATMRAAVRPSQHARDVGFGEIVETVKWSISMMSHVYSSAPSDPPSVPAHPAPNSAA